MVLVSLSVRGAHGDDTPAAAAPGARVAYPCNGVMKIHDESALTALASLPSSST